MAISFDAQRMQDRLSSKYYDTVIVGAGPYGLAIAAHMQQLGLHIAIFGKPLNLWREHMPKGMLLRSYWWATNISDPHNQFGLKEYFRAHSLHEHDPLEVEILIEYGLWFQHCVVPYVDETYVATIERNDERFEVTLVDGRVLQSLTVVMAPGLYYYLHHPAEYQHLPDEVISHTASHHTFERFAGKQVVVIGGGQSALETAALAYESGADVQVVSRRPIVWIKEFGAFPEHRPLIQRLREPKAGISAGWFNWLLEHFPYAFQRLPRSKKDEFMSRRNGPMGAAWLKLRLEGKVPLHESQQIQEIQETDTGVKLVLSDQKILRADHIILGTGYRVDIRKLPMLHSSIVSSIQTYQNAPILSARFESSIRGLYFVGISSVSSCGPLYRFVLGTDATARRVANSVAKQTAHTK
jgi:cation diffusion facilitator CzcD-associated flavoprotein CzcO